MSRPAVNSDTDFEVSKPLKGTAGWFDDRFGGARGVRTYLLRKVYPDHWSFLLGEIALYSFIILLLTGTFLSLFFVPSMTEVTYHGSYMKLDGIKMSEAYASTLRISFDVRGGLLIRQIHHWAADLFVAALISTCCGSSSPAPSASRARSTG
jgi:Cytochrome b subunit of the bc complex